MNLLIHTAGAPKRLRLRDGARLCGLVLGVMVAAAMLPACTGVQPPAAYGPCPTAAQLAWQRMETNMFCHFGPNTFSGLEWGEGTEPEDLFNPTDLDCAQWCAVAQGAGMKGVIITAKHHDGFCLWPNPVSSHTVRESSWRDGKGDVLRDLSDACRQYGLGFGVYISPWDRHAPDYGTPHYNLTFRQTLEDALSHYGPVFEQWFDGANGEGPEGRRQQYDWTLFNTTVAALQPHAVIFSDVGPGCRWVGNEQGRGGVTCWSRLTTQGFAPGAEAPGAAVLGSGQSDGQCWLPAEADVSLHDGWFYHPQQQPKSLQRLLSIYYSSVGRNALLLLNVPPDRRGRITEADSVRLMEFRRALDTIFACDLAQESRVTASGQLGGGGCRRYAADNVLDTAYHTYWAVADTHLQPTLTLHLREAVAFNRVMLQEYIPLGQRVAHFTVQVPDTNGAWRTVAQGTTIGYKRILLLPDMRADAVRICFDGCLAAPVINRVALYYDAIYRPEEGERQ